MTLRGPIELLSNVATLAVAALLSVVLVKVHLAPTPQSLPGPPRVAPAPGVGMPMASRLPGVDWNKNGRTLVLAISTQCHFCTESAPFYRRIQEENSKKLKIVAVLPQSPRDAEQYLNDQGVRVDQVQQVSLSTIGARGTPTILLVNEKGIVTGVWTGKLPEQDQEKLLSTLRGSRS